MSGSRGDVDLLGAWRQGDQQAGSALFERHFVSLHRFFATKVGPSVASDLVQQTFLALVEAKDRVRPDTNVKAYLFGVARNQLAMLLRSERRRGVPDILAESCVDALNASPTSVLGKAQHEEIVVRALRRIPIDLQSLLELHYWEGMGTAELSLVFDVPRGTIKSRLARARVLARAAFAELVEDAGGTPGSVRDLEGWVERLEALAPLDKHDRR